MEGREDMLEAESLSSLLGFGERLLTEVKKLAPKDVKIKVGPGSSGLRKPGPKASVTSSE